MNDVILTVKDVNRYIKKIFEYDGLLSSLKVEGEISNYKRHSSGHLYFSVKDNSGKLNCVMFRADTYSLNFEPLDGMKVIIEGYVSVFERNGNYQLYAKHMSKKGVGKLYEEYTLLLNQLREEGYFDEGKKKNIPKNVSTVAVVTSPTGAAIRDIISVITRRNKNINIIVCPVLVQGIGSSEDIAQTIYDINRLKLADVIITGRGGGSIEELWAFNERVVAQAVYDSAIPVVSAVGHETDFTICDFVADFRAPTPSVAGEVVSTPLDDIYLNIDKIKYKIDTTFENKVKFLEQKLYNMINKPIFKRPETYISNLEQYLDVLENNINIYFDNKVDRLSRELSAKEKLIESLCPKSILKRGYAIITKDTQIVSSIKSINKDDDIKINMYDGNIISTVKEIEK